MYYTDREIVGAYRRAENKKKIVKILAELNACTTDDILEVLEKNGCNVDKCKPRRSPASQARADKKREIRKELINEIKTIQFQNMVKLHDEAPKEYLTVYAEAYADLLIQLDKED